jgi:hypothetical protein
MTPEGQSKDLTPEKEALETPEKAIGKKTKNLYNQMEWAGAFGDVGTLIPFVVARYSLMPSWG